MESADRPGAKLVAFRNTALGRMYKNQINVTINILGIGISYIRFRYSVAFVRENR